MTGLTPKDHDASYTQSETALAVAHAKGQTIIVVAYNDETDTDATIVYTPTDRHVLAGASQMGWSYSLDYGKTWKYGGKVKPPSGWSVLWGDPAITISQQYYSYVFMSSLAIPNNKMPAGGFYGSVGPYIGGACVARSTDGGITFNAFATLNNQGHFYDGGSMASSRQGEVYAAFVDTDTDQIDVWRSPTVNGPFERLANPFPGKVIYSHPRIRVNLLDGSLYVAAEDQFSVIYMNRWNGSSWKGAIPASMPGGMGVIYPEVQFPSGKKLRTGPQFSFDIGAASDDQDTDAIRMLYTRKEETTGRLYVTGSYGPLTLTQFFPAPEWGTTPGNLNTPGDQFNPNVKAWGGFFLGLPPVWKATYLDRHPSGGDSVSLYHGNLGYLPNGTRIYIPFSVVKNIPVCPDARQPAGYWGDYDDLEIAGFLEGSSAPTFIRTMSDSSLGCIKQWTFTSQHLHIRANIFK